MLSSSFFAFAWQSVWCLSAVPVLGWVLLRIANLFFFRPTTLGVRKGRLAECPDTPNCVCSQTEDPHHYIEPLQFRGTLQETRHALERILSSLPRTRLISQTENYLQLEFVSRVCGYVDDVEFLFVPEQRLIHIRSASRIGYSDLGANRKRIEAIRQTLGHANSQCPVR